MRIGAQVGRVATFALLHGGSPTLHCKEHNSKWPTSGWGFYINTAARGVPNALDKGTKQARAHKWATWLHNHSRLGGFSNASMWGTESQGAHNWAGCLFNPCRMGALQRFRAGAEEVLAHKTSRWLHNPCCLESTQRFRAEDRIRSGPMVLGGYIPVVRHFGLYSLL